MKSTVEKVLIVDPGILFYEEKIRGPGKITFPQPYPFFTPGAISALLEFQRRGFRIHLITGMNVSQKLFSWGKLFLSKEKIMVSPLPPSSLKKIDQAAQGHLTLYALTPSLSKNLAIPFPPIKKTLPSFIESRDGTVKIFAAKDWLGFTQEVLHPHRRAEVRRQTQETDITIKLNLDGKGLAKVKTGLGFFDHMLTNFCKHSGIDLNLRVRGDLEVDEHHTIEDTALALGEGIRKALGDKRGLERYGFVLPMDESEVSCSIDFSGRSHLEWLAQPFKREYVGDFPTEMLKHFYNSFCLAAGLNMNMKITGENEHHMIESSFKGLARCLKQALRVGGDDIPSTKGSL